MILIVWNSQGDRWEYFWNNHVTRVIQSEPKEVVLGLLVESGWAPWVKDKGVGDNTLVSFPDCGQEVVNEAIVKKSNLFKDIRKSRSRLRAFWIPWVANLEHETNTRCSLGGVICRRYMNVSTQHFRSAEIIRPVVKITCAQAKSPVLTILLVHLTSGDGTKAAVELNKLISLMGQYVRGTAGMIVGDINIDIAQEGAIELPANWSVLRTGKPTHRKGRELDFALLYDPNKQLQKASAQVVLRYDAWGNEGDHSILRYDLTLPD